MAFVAENRSQHELKADHQSPPSSFHLRINLRGLEYLRRHRSGVSPLLLVEVDAGGNCEEMASKTGSNPDAGRCFDLLADIGRYPGPRQWTSN